jgi:hypothetical protein
VVDASQDLVAEGADVAIRLGELDDSAFGARKLVTLQRMLVASPAYLRARHAERRRPVLLRTTASSAPATSAGRPGRSTATARKYRSPCAAASTPIQVRERSQA